MAKLAQWKRPPSVMTRRMEKYLKILNKEMGDAIGQATYVVRDHARRRTFPAKSVSASDSVTGKPRRSAGQSPVRTKVYREEKRGTVSAVPYYTYAQSRGLRGVYARKGRSSELERIGLVIDPGQRGRYLQKHSPLPSIRKRQKPRLVLFSQDQALYKWAQQRRNGRTGPLMTQKAKIWLSDPQLIHELITRPALRKNTKKIRAHYERAIVTAGARF